MQYIARPQRAVNTAELPCFLMQETDGNCWSLQTWLTIGQLLTCAEHIASVVQLQSERCDTPPCSCRLLPRLNHRCCMAAANSFCHCATAALRPATAVKRCRLRSVLRGVGKQAGGPKSMVRPANCSHTAISCPPIRQSHAAEPYARRLGCCAACKPALLKSAARRVDMAPTAGVPESVLKKRRRCLQLFDYL